VFQLNSAASTELSKSCRALAMRVALRMCRDDCATAQATECPTQDLAPHAGDGDTWEWLVRASEVPSTLLDVSDNAAHALSFFGRKDYDCIVSWHSVCQVLVKRANVEDDLMRNTRD
jgi:hypothetical protein